MNEKKVVVVASIGVLALVGFIAMLVLTAPPAVPAGDIEAFARCLSEKGFTMYGAEWCPHCQNEKRQFGPAFKFVNYVECPEEAERCLQMGITGYPTWIGPDNEKHEGEQGLAGLKALSGCPLTLPEEK